MHAMTVNTPASLITPQTASAPSHEVGGERVRGSAAGRSARPARVPRRALHGVVLLDKPLGLSSNDALQKVKRLFRAEKAGHTGTLDPLATGLLPLCFGAATKFAQVSLDADKRYTATLKLGQTTTTGDAEGEVVSTRAVPSLSQELLQAACQACAGVIDQVPPMYSALKHEGRALYEYAREGVEIERKARRVTIHQIDILAWHDDQLTIDVRCSKGTYVRTLAEAIGEHIGCGAHLIGLRRTGSGTLDVQQAVTLERLTDMSETERDAMLAPVDALVSDWQSLSLDATEAGRLLLGMRRRVALADCDQVRVYGPVPGVDTPTSQETRVFLGSAHIKAGELIATRLLSPVEVQGLIDSLH